MELPLDPVRLAALSGLPELRVETFNLIEVDDKGVLLDSLVTFQYDPPEDSLAGGKLLFLPRGVTPAGKPRLFELRYGERTPRTQAAPLVSATDSVMHQGQASILVTTPAATWYYHKRGAGFASLLDRTGGDWISYRPCCESGGEYRGIPNMFSSDSAGLAFHPGDTLSSSVLESSGPLRARIRSVSSDNRWECVWDIYPAWATLTVLRAGGPYWFLYEGTPGGALDTLADYILFADSRSLPVTESWSQDLPAPEWLAFGEHGLDRVLLIAHHEDDSHPDQFWQMRGEMTVFGFGREFPCCGTYLRETPARFSVVLVEDTLHAAVARVADAAVSRPVARVTDIGPAPR